MPRERPWNKYYFSSRNITPGLPRFYAISTKKDHRKNLFPTHDIWVKTLYFTLYVLSTGTFPPSYT